MATTTTTPPTPTPPEVKAAPISLTPNAIAKVKGIMAQQNPAPAGLRVRAGGATACTQCRVVVAIPDSPLDEILTIPLRHYSLVFAGDEIVNSRKTRASPHRRDEH